MNLYLIKERGTNEFDVIWGENPKSAVQDHYLMNAVYLSGTLAHPGMGPIVYRIEYADDYGIYVEVTEAAGEEGEDVGHEEATMWIDEDDDSLIGDWHDDDDGWTHYYIEGQP